MILLRAVMQTVSCVLGVKCTKVPRSVKVRHGKALKKFTFNGNDYLVVSAFGAYHVTRNEYSYLSFTSVKKMKQVFDQIKNGERRWAHYVRPANRSVR